MKQLAIVLLSGVFAAASLPCGAQSACLEVAVEASVEAGQGQLTLADLLARETCPRWREAASQVSLGAVPRPGSVRVLDGRQIRRLLEELAGGGSIGGETVGMQIPQRIVVQRAGAMKSCAEIARFVASAAPSQGLANAPERWQDDLDCAGAGGIPQDMSLELSKTAWNAVLQRWEFALRCSRPEDCAPFLVWTREEKMPAQVAKAQSGTLRQHTFLADSSSSRPLEASPGGGGHETLVKRGQTATLTWDQGGIRIVLPVTCLDAGGLGQFVRVRFKNTARILRAEVVGDGTLQASL
jgi:hypothetical protein